jgi:chromosome segregation ATPase
MEAREIQENTCAAHVTADLTAENERLRREWGLLNVEYHKFKFKLTTANERITELLRQRDFASEKCLQLRTELADLMAENERLKTDVVNSELAFDAARDWNQSLKQRAEATEAELAAIRTSFPAKAQQAAEIMSEIQRSRNHVPRHGSETSPVMPIAEITAIILCALQGGE